MTPAFARVAAIRARIRTDTRPLPADRRRSLADCHSTARPVSNLKRRWDGMCPMSFLSRGLTLVRNVGPGYRQHRNKVVQRPRSSRGNADTGAMTEIESLIDEVRQLRAEVARLHAAHTAVHIRHGWMNMLLKDLSTNPYTQYKVHLWGAIYWLINFPLVCCLFFLTPTLWVKLGIFITLIYSIYANLATDYGAMSAAEAAFGQQPPPPIPLEPPQPLAPI
jgi:hypothetical protein